MTIKHATYGSASAASDPRIPTVSITVDDKRTGEFTAIVSVIGNVDIQGDVVVSGAFTKSLERLRESGNPIPVVWSHDWTDPFAHVGFAWARNVYEAKPGEFPQAPQGGLVVRGRFDVDKPFAKQVYDLVRERRVTEWSFAYDVVKQRKRSDGANELLVLDLLEVGPTLKGANEMTTTIDVKARSSSNESEKKAKASSILKMVEGTAYGDADRYIPGLYGEIGRAMRFEVDDPDSDVDDVVDAARVVVERHLTQKKWRDEDDERNAKLADRAVKQELMDLIADLAVGEKGQGRHEAISFTETNDLLVREHLRQHHPLQVAVPQLDRMNVDELNKVHKLVHGGGAPTDGKTDEALTKSVDQLIEDVRWQASRDRADREAFEAANAAVQLSGRAPGFAPEAEAERERELQQRDLERIEARAAERDAERASAEESDRISREDRNWHGDSYWTNDSAVPQPKTARERLEPRIDDQTVPDAGTTFTAPIYGVEGADYRLAPPETVPEAPAPAGETYRVRTASVDTPDTAVPLEPVDSFRIYAHQPEDSKVVAPEPPVPTVNETMDETFRMPAGGEVTDTMKDGDVL
jgi:HK97 family phage prohead protease